jgi:hypothetical protein
LSQVARENKGIGDSRIPVISNFLSYPVISLEEFKEILSELQVDVPEESLEVFRDLVVLQADTILDSYIREKVDKENE